MNKSALKKYAPQARKDFLKAVTRRAETLGLNPQSPGTVEHDGDVMLINGQPFPADLERQRTTLQRRIAEQGFAPVMDAMAYTWFNRLVAIRYMELHGFLDHGYRALSHPANAADGRGTGHTQREILDHIGELDLPGLDRSRALDLKLAGNRDEELYREVLLAQCHALHKAMPFLFESLDDATELLLPDGLLRTDSILGKLVTAIIDADWQDVEIIGWLYQFYISEKKDQVIGKVVKSEDIPAATQLFTPNWIVKYLVQNSLGRLWLMANPTSTLATKWEYYIKPAEQTPEVNAQLDALIQARINEDGATLNPESLTLLDPACGSGHILVEAYDLLRDIYLERGYRRQDIPRLILEKNLYGLDIDDRAAQLAGFALLMKARADDRRLFGQPVGLNVLALQEAKEGSAADLHSALNGPQIDYASVSQLVATFEQAKTFGSLIQIPEELSSALPELRQKLNDVCAGGDLLGRDAAETLLRLVAQAEVLAKQFDAVVANPPYMGGKGMNAPLKSYLKERFNGFEKDLFSAFMARDLAFAKPAGQLGFMSPFVWMFISSYEDMRLRFVDENTITSLVQLEYSGFAEATVPICTFTLSKTHVDEYFGTYIRLSDFKGADNQAPKTLEAIRHPDCDWSFAAKAENFKKIPGSPIAYWVGPGVLAAYDSGKLLSELIDARIAMATGDNGAFVRYWSEVSISAIGFDIGSEEASVKSGKTWFPCNKGGDFRKWYGNHEQVVNWRNGGEDVKNLIDPSTGRIRSHNYNGKFAFKECITWSAISSSKFGVRYCGPGFMFVTPGSSAFLKDGAEADVVEIQGLLSSCLSDYFVRLTSATMNIEVSNVLRIPFIKMPKRASEISSQCIELSKENWNSFERSWAFQRLPWVPDSAQSGSIQCAWQNWQNSTASSASAVASLETELNELLLDSYGLTSELDPSVSVDQVTLDVADRSKDCGSFLSFAIGCMMGRYSLDAPGLIYAHAGNEGFDPSRYQTFPADDDGIVPINDEAWFDDDGANRIREFVRVVWGEDTEAENMAWLAESLGSKASESADDTIRRYLSRDFYKDHLQTYKKRPIYWLFSSGKHKAFEALVYLHRYNAGTLSRMRMEYVVPLQSRMQSRIDSLEQDIHAATSSAETKRLQKQRDKLTKQLDELRRYDEDLRHYADQRITLDLDGGVKVNYGKFGDLLAEVKAVTGQKG